MCFSLAAVSLCGAQGAQRYKAAENSALGVGQVVVKRDRDTPGQIRGFPQKAADRLHGLGLTERGVGVGHDGVLHAAPDLDAQLPGHRE